jgi:hypothetical protein
MKTIELRHNPFKAETSITVDGREIHLACTGTGEGSHIQEWKDSVFPQLIKKVNIGPGSPCAVIFYGVEENYVQLQQNWKSYCEENKDIKIYFEYETKPPVSLALKETEIHELIEKYTKESPCDALKSTGFSAQIESIQNMTFPEYLEKAEKLYRQTNEYIKLVESLHLRDGENQQFVKKNAELDKLNADMEERRRLEAENAGAEFEKAAAKLKNEGKKEVECLFDETISGMNNEIDKLQSEIMEEINANGYPTFAFIYPRRIISIKESLIKLMNEKINTIIKELQTIYENISSSVMSEIDKSVIEPFDRKNIVEYLVEKNEDAGLTDTSPGLPPIISIGMLSIYRKSEEDLKQELTSIFDNAKKYFAEVSEKVKTYYLLEIDKIIDALKKKADEETDTRTKALELSHSANDDTPNRLGTEIKAIESRLNWIDDFETRLNNIFEL